MTYIPPNVFKVFNRQGEVVAEVGDYNSDQITNTSDIPGETVSEALESVGGGSVSSVFNRIGDVVADTGDYGSDQISNNSSVVGLSVSDALETLEESIPAPAPVSSVFGRIGEVVATTGDYQTSEINNDSNLPGLVLNDVLDYLAPTVVVSGSQLWASGVFQTVWTYPLLEGQYGSLQVEEGRAWTGTAATVTNSLFRYTNSFRRLTGGNAIVSVGLSSIQGNLISAQMRLIASGTDIVLQMSVNANVTVDYIFPTYLQEGQL